MAMDHFLEEVVVKHNNTFNRIVTLKDSYKVKE